MFGEAAGPALAERTELAQCHAPVLIVFEVSNCCTKKIRRHPAQRDALLAGFDAFQRLEIDGHAVDARDVIALAIEHRLSAYDASYLWLARELGAELVTLDGELQRAYAAMTAP